MSNEDTTATQNPATFDLIGMLTGRSFPEDDVVIYLDEATAYEIGKLDKIQQEKVPVSQALLNNIPKDQIELLTDDFIASVSKHDDALLAEMEEIDAKKDELRKKLDESKLTIHIKGYPRHQDDTLKAKMVSRYKNIQDNTAQAVAAQEYLTLAIWRASIEYIENSSGARIVAPDEATIKRLYDNIPESQKNVLETGIATLREASQEGFESKAQEQVF